MTSPWPCPAVMEALATISACRPGEMIYARRDPVEQWYRIVSGLARKCAVTPDGRRQIMDFLLPGDFFGFNAREKHPVTVEAVVEGTIVARYPRDRVETLADTDPQVGRYIRQMALQALSRAQARALILGRTARAGQGALLSGRDGRTLSQRRRGILDPAAVASGHRRLSRPLGRNGQPGAH
jgi:CRP/FNR family nitrogen fixation transcriptional regulator